jgi:GAF domain-containing protein
MTEFKSIPARIPANEEGRLAAVRRTGLMGSDATARFDIHTKLFRSIAQVPISYLGLIDETRQYFLSENFTGCLTDVSEVPREQTICQHALSSSQPVIVPDMRQHPTFAAHPLIAGDPYWVFWAGFPLITTEGYVLGTLCAVDFQPRSLSVEQIGLMRGVAADLTLSIQLQADHQERIAKDCAEVIAALAQSGLSRLEDASAFLDLCMERPVSVDRADALIQQGLVARSDGKLTLTASGNSLKTGRGLGPAEYKTKASPIRNTELLDAMFGMIE